MDDIAVRVAADGTETTLGEVVRRHEQTLVDLWSSTCPRCPASLKALDAMNTPATKIALLCRDNSPDVADQVRADSSSSVVHLTLCNEADIEGLKELLAFKFFPYAALVNGACQVLQMAKDVSSIFVFSLAEDF
jgi:hypothetical protein